MQKVFLISILLLTMAVMPMTISAQDVVISSSMCVDTSATVYIEANVHGDDADIKNDGSITVNSTEGVEVVLPKVMDGEGVVNFSGDDDFYVTSTSGAQVPSLLVNTVGEVTMDADLSVNSTLNLTEGIIYANSGSKLAVLSTDEDAIVYVDDQYATSYVVGYLERNVVTGSVYYYPVGGDDFHPLMLRNSSSDTKYKVVFDKDIPEAWKNITSVSNVMLLDDLGWEVNSDETSSGDFIVGLSRYLEDDLDDDEFKGVFYSPDRTFDPYQNDLNSYLTNDYMISSQSNGLGVYALSIEFNLDSLANFIYVGLGNKTVFKIPEFSNYTNVKLNVVDRLGKLVFKSDNYTENFDVSDLTSGTYFYELVLKKENYERTVYNFIEVKHEFK